MYEPTSPLLIRTNPPYPRIRAHSMSATSSPIHPRPTRTLPGGRVRRSDLRTGPNNLPLCRWCELEILAKRRRTFCSDYCVHQWRLRTDPGYLRDQVFARDRGICAACQADTIAIYNAL